MIELHSTNSVNKPIRWFALLGYYHKMSADLYSKISNHKVYPLYANTALQSAMSYSPYVVELSANDPLIKTLPEHHAIYFSALQYTSFEQIITLLQCRMKVIFDNVRQGYLHYYHREIASYFFSASESDTQQWLAYLAGVKWLNQIKGEKKEWKLIENTSIDFNLVSDEPWALTQAQERYLMIHAKDKLIHRWQRQSNKDTINWPNQRSVFKLCEDFAITGKIQINKLRELTHQYDVNFDLYTFKTDEVRHWSDEDKVDLLEKNLVKEIVK